MDGTEGSPAAGKRARHMRIGGILLMLTVLLAIPDAHAAKLRISNRYSPLSKDRAVRARTDYIVLHTTEGQDNPSLRRVRNGGLAHYVVMRDGRVYRTVHRDREARHAGCSMWNGRTDLDEVSIGIEVVGWHNRPITGQQELAIAELVRQLQKIYKISDERVLTHSMVAYGKPNRWHRKPHRGRKRCGMQFAQTAVRRRLDLHARPLEDPDVKAGRLVVADPFLAAILYAADDAVVAKAEAEFEAPDADVITATRTAWFIARDEYDAATTVYVFPDGRRRRGDKIADWAHMPAGTKVLLDQEPATASATGGRLWREIGRDGGTAGEVAGAAYRAGTTVYVWPGGKLRRGDQMTAADFKRLPTGTRVFLGYRVAGEVTARRTAYEICGPAYGNETTLYVMPGGGVKHGGEISDRGIPGGTWVLVGS
jgi:N-acetylmuramoyl-L-alanine amidase